MKKQMQFGLLTSLLVVSAAPALAAEATGSFDVSATVGDSCSVSAADLAFGNVDPLSATATTATAAIDVTCSNGTSYDVGLDAGGAAGATVTSRAMGDGDSNTLNYALYTDAARTNNWGNTVGTDTVSGTGNGSAQTQTVYGEIPGSQSGVPTGTYSDTINLTVTY
jgi:spore coat protein U-like protein